MSRLHYIVCSVLLCFAVACTSSPKSKKAPKKDVDTGNKKYTSEDAAKYEISTIKKLKEKDSVKALWRAKLFTMNNPDFASGKALYAEYVNEIAIDYNSAVKAKNYLEALRLFVSLDAVGYKNTGSLSMQESELTASIKKNVPGLANKNAFSTLSESVKGTVTVYVDKGIKVQGRVGYNDAVLGSGFFISKDGYIITNHHVIADCVDPEYEGYARLYIYLAEDSDTRIPAKIIGYDKNVDLALLKTEVDAPYVFTLGSSERLKVGDKVYAIGSPLGLERTLTSGIISAKDRELFSAGKVFQIDAAVNAGNSGGPMIDSNGVVQAIVFAGVPNYQGLNFAIPVEYLRYELPIFYSKGERKSAWIGCYGKTKRRAGSGAENEGLSVEYVMPGSTAALAGMKAGETIVEVGGTRVTSLDDFKYDFMQREAGTIVKIKCLDKNGKSKTHIVYLDERPAAPGNEVYIHDTISEALIPLLGMELKPGSSTNKNLYVIERIVKGSLADTSGFTVEDPVQVLKTEMDVKNGVGAIQIYAKKRNNGYLDTGVGYSVPLDTQYYF